MATMKMKRQSEERGRLAKIEEDAAIAALKVKAEIKAKEAKPKVVANKKVKKNPFDVAIAKLKATK
tara:strand:- start:231 stop:428 length:198 start_codon:yes stop_codon:yes gene_type:complete